MCGRLAACFAESLCCSEWETLDSDNAKAEAALLQQL